MRLSAIIITRNESQRIAACIDALGFVDEIIVVDHASSDDTADIAQSKGAKVIQSTDWPGFGPQKNRALDLAKGQWVISIDADELVTQALQTEILAVLTNPLHSVYSFPRLSSYCGQNILHSGWYPDRVVRLFKRDSARFSDDLVHEKIVSSHTVGHLRQHLLHASFSNLESVLDKVNGYSTAGAQALFKRGKKASLGKALGHGLWAFLRTYILRFGFLDGRMGLVLAISNAEGTYYRYLKLWLMSKESCPPK
jgi:glycosyltransferase involved in cell wall biosynthesis